MNPVTPERIAEIRKRLYAATKGPWDVAPHSDDADLCEIVADYSELPGGGKVAHWIAQLDAQVELEDPQADIEQMNANAEFIAHSWADIRDLLRALDAATAEGAKTQRMLEIERSYIERIMPCPDCRDKIERGKCERCKRQNAEARADAAERQVAAQAQEIAQVREALTEARRRAHRVAVNNGWGDKRAANLALDIRELADEVLAASRPIGADEEGKA